MNSTSERVSIAMKKKWAERKSKRCCYCDDVFSDAIEARKCESSDKFMIECYMHSNKCDFEEAKSMFLMERI